MIYKNNYTGGSSGLELSQSKHRIIRPTPIDREVVWEKDKILMSKTDKYGNIEYANDAFIEVSSYEDFELMSQPHSIIRHPDMPKVIFKVLWENIKAGKNYHAIIKNMAKTGRYYWVITNFEIKKDEKGDNISYIAYRKAVPESIIKDHISPFYERLLKIEKITGIEASEKYFRGYFEEKGTTYYQFITNLLKDIETEITEQVNKDTGIDTKDEKAVAKGFFARFFS